MNDISARCNWDKMGHQRMEEGNGKESETVGSESLEVGNGKDSLKLYRMKEMPRYEYIYD
jgi:hypothetical protein